MFVHKIPLRICLLHSTWSTLTIDSSLTYLDRALSKNYPPPHNFPYEQALLQSGLQTIEDL